LTVDHRLIADADAVVLPGVGAFGACMKALREADLEDPVEEAVDSGPPVPRHLCRHADAVRQQRGGRGCHRPRGDTGHHPLARNATPTAADAVEPVDPDHPRGPDVRGIAGEAWVYFVHSLHAVPNDPAVGAATCSYGAEVNAAFRYGNVFATQFHPEKSGEWGIALLANFVRVCAEAAVS
jgi:glutamine amidotransferase